jgi:hypothetical protein
MVGAFLLFGTAVKSIGRVHSQQASPSRARNFSTFPTAAGAFIRRLYQRALAKW